MLAVLADAEHGRRAIEHAQASVDRIRRDIERITVTPELAAALVPVASVFDRRGSVAKDQTDLPRVIGERDQFSAKIQEMAARIGIRPERFEEGQPTDAEIARIEQQLARHADAERRIEELDGRLAEDDEALRKLEEDRPRSALMDPAPWRSRLAALKPDLDRLISFEAASIDLASRRRRLGERAARLDPPVLELARLARAPLPSRAETAERRDAIHAARSAVEAIEARLNSLHGELAELDRTTTSADFSTLPTLEAIAAARSARDAALSALGGGAQGAPSAEELSREIRGVQALTAVADTLVDTALRETERLARLASARERQAAISVSVGTEEAILDEARVQLASLQTAYEASFQATGIQPRSPENMLDWLAEVVQLLELREEIETEAERISGMDHLGQSLLEPLRRIGEELVFRTLRAFPWLRSLVPSRRGSKRSSACGRTVARTPSSGASARHGWSNSASRERQSQPRGCACLASCRSTQGRLAWEIRPRPSKCGRHSPSGSRCRRCGWNARTGTGACAAWSATSGLSRRTSRNSWHNSRPTWRGSRPLRP